MTFPLDPNQGPNARQVLDPNAPASPELSPVWVDPRLPVAVAYVHTRFFPPLPAAYGALALEALDAVNEDDLGRPVLLPVDLDPKPRAAIGDAIDAGTLYHVLRLDRFAGEWL